MCSIPSVSADRSVCFRRHDCSCRPPVVTAEALFSFITLLPHFACQVPTLASMSWVCTSVSHGSYQCPSLRYVSLTDSILYNKDLHTTRASGIPHAISVSLASLRRHSNICTTRRRVEASGRLRVAGFDSSSAGTASSHGSFVR